MKDCTAVEFSGEMSMLSIMVSGSSLTPILCSTLVLALCHRTRTACGRRYPARGHKTNIILIQVFLFCANTPKSTHDKAYVKWKLVSPYFRLCHLHTSLINWNVHMPFDVVFHCSYNYIWSGDLIWPSPSLHYSHLPVRGWATG